MLPFPSFGDLNEGWPDHVTSPEGSVGKEQTALALALFSFVLIQLIQ